MPFDALTYSDNFRIQGSMSVVNDPAGNAAAINNAGTLVQSGTVSFGSNMQLGSSAAFVGGMPAGTATNQVQLLGTSSAGISQTITMSGSGRVVPVSFTNTSTVSIGLTPTLSTSTGGNFQDGAEITILNLSPSGTNLVIPSSLMGSISNAGIVTVSAMRATRFVYSALLQSWIPVTSS